MGERRPLGPWLGCPPQAPTPPTNTLATHDSLLLSRAPAHLASLLLLSPPAPFSPGGLSLAHRESSWQPAIRGA